MSDADKVRVLDDGPSPRPGIPAASRSGSWVIFVVAAVLGGVLWATGMRTADPPEASPPALGSAVAPGSPPEERELPDLRGARYGDIDDILSASGFVDGSYGVASAWIASNSQPEGRILAQQPEPGRVPSPVVVQVIVSSGSPVVSFREMPAHVREWVVSLPGFDPAEPIRAMETLAGTAYKTDDWVFGECAAVLLVRNTFADPEYGEECTTRKTTSISGTLLDGTRYVVGGLDAEPYAFTSVSGVIVYDDGEAARALGITTHGRTADFAPPSVSQVDNTLRIEVGTWFTEVAVQAALLESFDAAIGPDLAAAIRPSTYRGHPVVELVSPLRWQTPGEIPSRIEVDYGEFRVVAGCIANVTNVVCDPTGSVSVEGVQTGFDVSGVSIVVQDR